MIKTLNVSLGQIGAAQQNPLGIAVPDITQEIYATGYYIDPLTGTEYYYDSVNEQWYYYVAGYIYPLGISWKPSPSPMIDLIGGVDILRFRLSFKYIGPMVTQKFYAIVGDNDKAGAFGEWDGWWVRKDIILPQRDTITLFTDKYVDVPIKTGKDGQDFAAYCKKDQFFIEEGKDSTPYYYDVGHVIKAEGEFTEMKISKFEKV